ncbi:MAG: 1-acyl-sn-glycerol-3-phosphate acyltransferase, partial [Chlamydiae bacterium]|nr:1-acyl-sn-glycerol-3-phosphate acyltransferase [Chlamydiota bacterium]
MGSVLYSSLNVIGGIQCLPSLDLYLAKGEYRRSIPELGLKGALVKCYQIKSKLGTETIPLTQIIKLEDPLEDVHLNYSIYFGDVIAFVHIFCAVKWGKFNKLGIPYYLLNPFTNVFFVAAEETMNSSWLTRLFKLGGALTVKRTWRAEGEDVNRDRDVVDTQKIDKALSKSWVITFPQGSTKPFAPGRKGTAHIIKNNQPIVVPVVINGFWRAFTKKGLTFKKVGTPLTVRFKPALVIDYNSSVELILDQVMD